MLLPELKAEIMKLPPGDRLALVAAIVESLQETPVSMNVLPPFTGCGVCSKQTNPHPPIEKSLPY